MSKKIHEDSVLDYDSIIDYATIRMLKSILFNMSGTVDSATLFHTMTSCVCLHFNRVVLLLKFSYQPRSKLSNYYRFTNCRASNKIQLMSLHFPAINVHETVQLRRL